MRGTVEQAAGIAGRGYYSRSGVEHQGGLGFGRGLPEPLGDASLNMWLLAKDDPSATGVPRSLAPGSNPLRNCQPLFH